MVEKEEKKRSVVHWVHSSLYAGMGNEKKRVIESRTLKFRPEAGFLDTNKNLVNNQC